MNHRLNIPDISLTRDIPVDFGPRLAMSAPRAARRGRVASATPPSEGSTPAETPQDQPKLDDSSSLLSSFLRNADTTTAAPVGIGIVRGRGLNSNVKETATSAERGEVEARVRAAIESIGQPESPSDVKEMDAAGLKHVQHNDITLMGDAERTTLICRLASQPRSRVLVVSPQIDQGDVTKCTEALQQTGVVGTFEGSQLSGNPGGRLLFTTLATFLMYLKEVRKTGVFSFSHIVFAGCIHAGRTPPEFDVVIAALRDELRNTTPENCARVIICGITQDEISSFFEPLRCAEVVSPASARDGAITVFSADETAALCDVSLKTTTSASIPRGPTTSADAIHQQLINHLHDTARLILELLLEHFESSKPMQAVVFVSDPADLDAHLRRHGIHEKVDITFSLLPLDGTRRHTVVLATRSISDSAAAKLYANVVIDLGVEKRLVAAPPAEATMPLRQTVRASARESAARLHVLGWRSAGIAFQVLAGPPAASVREEDTLQSLTSSVLRSLRAQVLLPAVRSGHFRAENAHNAAVDAALFLLSEQCAIASPEQPSTTFLGDLVGRLPFPVEGGVLVAHGLVFGMPEAFTAVACALTFDIFGTSPSQDTEHWQQRCLTFLKGSTLGLYSDVLAAACVIADAAKGGKIADIAASTGANEQLLERALEAFHAAIRELKDYVFLPNVSAHQLRAQIEDHLSQLTYILATVMARNAVVVRGESDELKNVREKGRMMFLRTTKDVNHGAWHPSGVKWTTGAVVVPGFIANAHARFTATNVTTLSHNFFHAALLLMHPSLSFDVLEEGSVLFCVNVNRHPKRLITDTETSAKILDFREKWCQLLGIAMAKRSSGKSQTVQQFNAALASHNRKLDVEGLRQETMATLKQLVQDIETKETQTAPALSRVHLLAPTQVLPVQTIAMGSDEEIIAQVLRGVVDQQPASDDVEIEGAHAAPLVEDDVEIEGASVAPIIEED
jgi:hypothetical protein